MSFNHTKAGPNLVPAYQLSGIPYVTASASGEVKGTNNNPLKLEFPFATRFFQIRNTDASNTIRVGFSEAGVQGAETLNYFLVAAGKQSEVLELRCKDLFFNTDHATNTASFQIIAGLTSIERNEFPTLTGSAVGGFEGIG